jgi:protein disulfide-isomerase-like protein
MKHLVIIAALLVSCVLSQEGQSDVVVLTTANFKDKIATGDWLVEFYAPWCGHCKKLIPTYEQLATTLKGKVNVAKVDCTVESDIQEAFGIPGFPTIKFIKDNQVYDYTGDRSHDNFVAFVEGAYKSGTPKALPTLEKKAPVVENENSDVVVLTDANFDELVSKGSWLLEFYAPWCGHCKKLIPTYEQVATALKGKVNVGKVDCTVQTSLSRRFSIKSYPTIKFAKDGEIRDYKLERTVDALTQFATSGYTTVEASAIPAKPTPMEDFIEDTKATLRKVEGFLAQRMWVSVSVAFVLGVVIGAFVFGGSKSPRPTQPKIAKND